MAAHLPPFLPTASSIPMLKITRMTNARTTTLIVSGRIDAEQLPDLRRLVEAEHVNPRMDGPREAAAVSESAAAPH
jgi:hypothetical protein